jgi:hypothetical protein
MVMNEWMQEAANLVKPNEPRNKQPTENIYRDDLETMKLQVRNFKIFKISLSFFSSFSTLFLWGLW